MAAAGLTGRCHDDDPGPFRRDAATAVRASASVPELAALDTDTLRAALTRMHLIRNFEETAEASYMRGLIHGTMHLSIGQEASAVGVDACRLRRRRLHPSTHRGHGHCIAKGADPALMFAEFFGKENGYCRGRGGSMHIADVEGGNLGANGIVGGGLPIAVGVGMSIKMQKQDRVCMVFFGDGAANEGAFHEALNMASIWKLPVVFVCENNKYGMSMDIARAMAVPNVADRAALTRCRASRSTATIFPPWRPPRGRPSTRARERRRARAARMQDLSPGAAIRRATATSTAPRKRSRRGAKRDPISRFETRTGGARPLHEARDRARSRRRRNGKIDAALEFAKASPDPDPRELTRDVYAD